MEPVDSTAAGRLARGMILWLVLAGLAGFPGAAGARDEPGQRGQAPTIWIPSRGIEVPATFMVPETGSGRPVPLVVMAHGHGGSRDEAGGFRRMAAELARRGVASIRVDFAGCGESREAFTANAMATMIADLLAAQRYAASDARVDARRIGVLGYSMGGRVALAALAGGAAYSSVALWAPAAGDGPDALYAFMGGPAAYRAARKIADTGGTAPIVTPWGARQTLGADWFRGLEEIRPMAALPTYGGALLVIHGDEDEIIDPRYGAAVADAAALARPTVYVRLPDAGHGLGFYDSDASVADAVVSRTADFLAASLSGPPARGTAGRAELRAW